LVERFSFFYNAERTYKIALRKKIRTILQTYAYYYTTNNTKYRLALRVIVV